jgi:probable rRNA maturation factor
MNQLDIQIATAADNLPTAAQFQQWADLALADQSQVFEVTLRLVDEPESAELNLRYRHKKGATNILSFPFEVPEGIDLNLLGDLVICAPVIEKEALTQHKQLLSHWAHIVIHGILHLRGYDHIEEEEALNMEAKEIAVLNTLNISNPYQE